MKKLSILFLAVLLVFAVSCDSENVSIGSPTENSSQTSNPAEPTTPSTEPTTPPAGSTSKAIGTLAELEKAVKTEGSYHLTADITVVGYLNITAPITIDGKDKTIKVDYQTETCSACNGAKTTSQTCHTCNGLAASACGTCGNTGIENVACSTCNGSGKVALDNASTGLVIASEGVTLKNIKFASKNAGARDSAHIIVKTNGTKEKPIVIDSCSFNSAKELSETFHESGIISHYGAGDYLTVKNCAFKNLKYGMYFNQISNAEISGNTIDGTKYNGINIAADSSDYPCATVKLENNTLTNISYANYSGTTYSCGIYLGDKCSDISLLNNNVTMLNGKDAIVESYRN